MRTSLAVLVSFVFALLLIGMQSAPATAAVVISARAARPFSAPAPTPTRASPYAPYATSRPKVRCFLEYIGVPTS